MLLIWTAIKFYFSDKNLAVQVYLYCATPAYFLLVFGVNFLKSLCRAYCQTIGNLYEKDLLA